MPLRDDLNVSHKCARGLCPCGLSPVKLCRGTASASALMRGELRNCGVRTTLVAGATRSVGLTYGLNPFLDFDCVLFVDVIEYAVNE